MAEQRVLGLSELPVGAKKTITLHDTEILLLRVENTADPSAPKLFAVQAKCPHAGAPLEKGAICHGRLVCPWHMGTFALDSASHPVGALLEPPAMERLKAYPIRLEGEDIFVDPGPIPPSAPRAVPGSDAQTVLLVGGGAASAMAAVTLRDEGFAGRIVIVDPVEDEPVDRTQLSKMALSGKIPLAKVKMPLPDAERIVTRVSAFSAAYKEATLSDARVIAFDAALVATGGTPKRLEIPGAERAFTLRHTDDVRRILAVAENKQRAVILGTSFIGLEAASALTAKGLHATVVGREKLPFAKKFGAEVAQSLKNFHAGKGTGFQLGVEPVSIGEDGVLVRSAAHEGIIPADLVVMGVGVTPNLDFTHDLPLEADGSIRVGRDLKAADRVWVAGDIASVEGTRIEHWRLAEQHGRLAALQMLGEPASYDGVPFFWTFHHGKRLGYLGHAEDWDEIVYDGSVEELTFLAYYLKAGKVAAVLSCGRDTDTAMLAEVLREQPTRAEARRAIAG